MTTRKDDSHWSAHLFFLVYTLGALLLAGYAAWQYLTGDYGNILLPALLSLLLAGAIFLRLANSEYRHLSAYLALISCYLLIAIELPRQDQQAILWLGLPPVLTLLLLPLGAALLLNLTLTPVWLVLLGSGLPLLNSALAYLALVSVATLPCWVQQRREALLRAARPYDPQCEALARHVLTERLTAEVERARAMKRPLTVLVIHLPQLEMADEQFGPALLQALLDRLCQIVRSCCRHHDLLGRHQTTLFWLLLPDTGEAGALIVRERLLTMLHRQVFAETGTVQARLHTCHLNPEETAVHFEQRLLAAGLKLMEPVP